MIGIGFNELKSILKAELYVFNEEELDDGIRQVYEFDSSALMVYVNDEKVILVSASGPYLELK